MSRLVGTYPAMDVRSVRVADDAPGGGGDSAGSAFLGRQYELSGKKSRTSMSWRVGSGHFGVSQMTRQIGSSASVRLSGHSINVGVFP